MPYLLAAPEHSMVASAWPLNNLTISFAKDLGKLDISLSFCLETSTRKVKSAPRILAIYIGVEYILTLSINKGQFGQFL